MTIRCIVACTNSYGSAAFFHTRVRCREVDVRKGYHLDRAREQAVDEGYEGEMVVFDARHGPAWLFEQFDASDEEE